MEQATDASEPERTAADTDWLAHSIYGWGIGFTKEQALIGMAAGIKSVDRPLTVELVEHVGDIKTGLFGWSVDEFVSGERYELDPDEFNELRDAAIKAHADAELLLDVEPERVEPDGPAGPRRPARG